jgi:UDP-N-acetylglucosamine 2-epimerase (non-hydrolysing)
MFLICFGTRPEYIKVKSLIDNLNNCKTCFTGQHSSLLKNIHADFTLDIKEINTNRLNNVIINILSNNTIFENIKYVIVQGDTVSALSMALSAFNNKIKVIHLEAGLRTYNIYDPYPEELNRQLISKIANIHLCPTELNKTNLINEGINSENIYVTGNTGLDNINKLNITYGNKILITLHRHDNYKNIDRWFKNLEKLAILNPILEFIIPIHPNPNIQKYKYIFKKVKVIDPLEHSKIIELVKECRFIISDSGGLQEEASFLNKKIIICRNSTERPEILETHGVLCKNPEDLNDIFESIKNNFIINKECPFGDGFAYKKIINVLNFL